MKLAIIINPISGKSGSRAGAAELRVSRARHAIDRPNVHGEVLVTHARGHGAALARDCVARRFDVVVAWGGDGTVNEIAGPLIGTPTALAVVPSGSGDGLARGLGLPSDPATVIDAAIAKPPTAIDVGYLGGRHFLNIAGVGFDAAIATAFNNRSTRGGLGYVTGALGAVWSYRAQSYAVTLDDQHRQGRHLMVAFANGREYGNGLVLSPGATAWDGWLDVVAVDDGPAWQQLWRSRRLAFGSDRPVAGVHRTRVRQATVAGEHLVCHTDGETFEASGTLDVKLVPGALNVCGLVR